MSSDSTILSVQQQSTAVVFLDFDGVLIGDRTDKVVWDQTLKKVVELFGKNDAYNYEDIQWKTAFSHCLEVNALNNLHNLIDRVSKVMNVAIVISSEWRESGTVTDLKEKVFVNHAFSQHIIDKTVANKFLDEQNGLHRPTNRGKQIEYWLKMNRDRFNVQSYVILDDDDDDISRKFPYNFVQTNRYSLLTKDHVEKAIAILTQPVLGINVVSSSSSSTSSGSDAAVLAMQ
jgi:HAD domain in Swiss Army Knife RNA repair proteins